MPLSPARPSRCIPLVAATAGGLLSAAFLQAAVAAADTAGNAAEISDNAFTVGDFTFDPGSDGYGAVDPFVGIAPLLKIGFGSFGANPAGTQDLVVYDSSGSVLGTAHASVNASDLLGIDSAQFTVQSLTPPVDDIQAALTGSGLDFNGVNVGDVAEALTATGFQGIEYGAGDITGSDVSSALRAAGISLDGTDITNADIAGVLNGIDVSALPDEQTVYSITNLGAGWANVYVAVPNDDGTAAASITDTLVTPFGNFDIVTSYDAVAALDPDTVFDGFAATTDNPDIGDYAFTLGGTTFDPGADGFTPVNSMIEVAPLLQIGGGVVKGGGIATYQAKQDLDVYGANGTDLGSVTTGLNTQNLLGIEATQFTVIDGEAADGVDAAALPVDGTVYSVTDFGGGWANVYIATPTADGTAAATITDTFVTPYGSFELPTSYDAIALMDPGAALDGLGAEGSGLSDNAFTIGGITLDPGSDGFDPVSATSGIAPLMQIGGGTLGGTTHFANESLAVYGESGELGSIVTAVNTLDLFGLVDGTVLTVDGYDVPATDLVAALQNSDIDFSGADFDAAELVAALEGYGNTFDSFVLGTGELTGLDFWGPMFWAGFNVFGSGIDLDELADVINGAVDDYSAGLPEMGTVYSVVDFGGGWSNVYWALPDADGDAAASIHDMLMMPFGNLDLSSVFDAIADLDPGDAAAGVSDIGAAAFDLFDPSTWF